MKAQDINVPDPPAKGSDWASWVRWLITLVTLIISAYVTWSEAKTAAEKASEIKAVVQSTK